MRIAVQTGFFLLAPSLFAIAFSGIKQFFFSVHQGEPLVFNGFTAALIALCVFTMLFGRFFCGYACAFGSLGDLVYYLSGRIQKKTEKRIPGLPEKACHVLEYVPFLILFLIILLCALGIYNKLSGWSPWEVFSLVMTGNFHLGGLLSGVVLFAMIIIGMAAEPRFFCRFLCPMGAVFRLMPVFPWAILRRDREQCISGCSACRKTCPVRHELGAGKNAANCISCGKCVDICPRGNIRIGSPSSIPFFGAKLKEKNPELADTIIQGNELWLTAAKAVLLLIIAFAVGAVRIF